MCPHGLLCDMRVKTLTALHVFVFYYSQVYKVDTGDFMHNVTDDDVKKDCLPCTSLHFHEPDLDAEPKGQSQILATCKFTILTILLCLLGSLPCIHMWYP